MTQREGYPEGKFALGGLTLCQVEKTVEVGIFFSLTCLTFTVVAKRSSIEDLVLMRTKLLKWSSFYTKVLIFPIIMYHNALRLCH